MDYYIENGVRRAIAAREAKLQSILATLYETGKPPTKILVKLDSLHSPKKSISKSHPRYQSVVQGMSTPQGRARMPEIQVQPLGEPGQQPTVPFRRFSLIREVVR
jgi:hypothetical protein